ncbi:MAG: hypothetical protein SO028_11390 [Prevotella sp.]|nr:hypothetical protein [Prevotella sp.]
MINLLTVLTWFTSKKEYLSNYADNESAKKAATRLWNAIDSSDWIPFVIMIILTVAICLWYFFPYNNEPGRHYHPKHWAKFGVVNLILVCITTLGLCCILTPNPSFDIWFLVKIVIANTFYALVLYYAISNIINRKGKSNAYPWYIFKNARI